MNRPKIDLRSSKILIVDDVPANLDVLSQALEAAEYNVLVATDGEMAIKVAHQSQPDLVLLDVMMPGIDGFETCRRLKADDQTQDIPVIFLTARDELEGVLEGFYAGGVDYVSKPFQKEEVLIRIRTHLERDRLARDLVQLNAHLEQKVEERTLELRQKVIDLVGKDRIAQHLLTYHTLDETLNLILEVISEVTELDSIVIHLREGDSFKPAAAIGIAERGLKLTPEQLTDLQPGTDRAGAFSELEEKREFVNVTSPTSSDEVPFALIPILRGNELLGAYEVDNRRN